MEDILFKMPEIINHNSHEYDLALLEEIKNLRNIPVDKFDSTMRKIMRKKVLVNYGLHIFRQDSGMENRNVIVIIVVFLFLVKQEVIFA